MFDASCMQIAEPGDASCQCSAQDTLLWAQMAELEAAADALVELESRAEVAESERDAALAAARSLTPRPGLPAALPLAQRLGPAGAARLDEALQRFRCGCLESGRMALLRSAWSPRARHLDEALQRVWEGQRWWPRAQPTLCLVVVLESRRACLSYGRVSPEEPAWP